MAETTETDYSAYTLNQDGNPGIREHNSILAQFGSDMNKQQRDILHFLGALKDVADATLPEDFLSEGWGDVSDPTGEDNLPDPTLVPVIYITEGINLWMAPNNPDDYDLGDGTTDSGTAWVNIYADVVENYAISKPTGYGDNSITTSSATWTNLSATHFALNLTVNSGIVDVRFMGNFASDGDSGSMYIGYSIDDTDEFTEGFRYELFTASEDNTVKLFDRKEGLTSGTYSFKMRWRRDENDTIRIRDDNAIFLVSEVLG